VSVLDLWRYRGASGMTAFDDLLSLGESQASTWHIDARDKDPRGETERQLEALRLARIHCPAVDIIAVPNAGRRTRWEVAQRRREGMKAGALDWVVTWNHGVAFCEWKDGSEMPTSNQSDRLDMYQRWGFHCGVFRRADSFFAWLSECGAPVLGVRL